MGYLDQEALTELLEMEAVPVCNTLASLLGRNARATVTELGETDMEALVEYLPHFNVVIEAERTAEGLRVPQLYVFDRADMVKISNFIMGLPVNTESPLDEIALSTLKEVASQCMGAAMDDLGDFLGREMGEVLTRVTAFDSAERILDTIRRCRRRIWLLRKKRRRYRSGKCHFRNLSMCLWTIRWKTSVRRGKNSGILRLTCLSASAARSAA